MAIETLSVPESKLREVITVIRVGLANIKLEDAISEATIDNLLNWCAKEEEYLDSIIHL